MTETHQEIIPVSLRYSLRILGSRRAGVGRIEITGSIFSNESNRNFEEMHEEDKIYDAARLKLIRRAERMAAIYELQDAGR